MQMTQIGMIAGNVKEKQVLHLVCFTFLSRNIFCCCCCIRQSQHENLPTAVPHFVSDKNRPHVDARQPRVLGDGQQARVATRRDAYTTRPNTLADICMVNVMLYTAGLIISM